MRSLPLVLLLLVLARVLFLSACCWLAVLLSCLLLAMLFSSSSGPLLTSCKSALLTGPLCVHSPLEMTRRDVHPRVDQPSTWVASHPHTSSRAARGLLVSSTTLVSLPRAAREGLLSVSRLLNQQTEHITERSFQRSLALVLCIFRFGLWAAGQLTGRPAEAQSRCDSPQLSLLRVAGSSRRSLKATLSVCGSFSVSSSATWW